MKKLLILASLLGAFATAQAHFIWAIPQPDGHTVKFELAESPGDSVVPYGQFVKSGQYFGLSAEPKDEAAPLRGTKSAGVHALFGVHGSDLVHWSAKAAANLRAASETTSLPADITVKTVKGLLIARVTKNGRPTPDSLATCIAPGSSKVHEFRTNAKGEFQLGKSTAGLWILSAIIVENTPGTYNGTPYKDRQDMATLCFRI